MKKLCLFAAAVGVAALLQGCATGMSKSQYAVDVISEPMGQEFKIYNRKGEYIHQGKTPEIVVLDAQSDFFTKEMFTFKFGKKKTERKLTATLSPWYWGNFTQFVGFAVDGITGAMWALPKTTNISKEQPANQLNL